MSKLNNNDFSRLLNQADKDVLAEVTRKKKPTDSSSIAKHRKRSLQWKQREKAAEQRKKVTEERGEKAVPTWRDRAEERRKAAGEYARVAEEYKILKERSEEESKFLGGDVGHTHLVKGLDYVLLEKVRSEIQKKEAEKLSSIEEKQQQHGIVSTTQKASASSLLARKICNEIVEQVHPHHTSFQKKLQRIDSVVLRGAHFRGNTKIFQPGRMIYQFDLNWDMGQSEVPVVVFQALEQSSQRSTPDNGVIAPVHEKILNDLTDILDWNAHNKLGRRSKREAPRSYVSVSQTDDDINLPSSSGLAVVPPASVVIEDDEDIFGGVGVYNPSENTSVETDEDEISHHQYFDQDEEKEEPHSVRSLLPSSLVSKADAVRRRGGEDVEMKKAAVDDYDECYPDTGVEIGWHGRGEESEEEEDGKKKKRKGVSI